MQANGNVTNFYAPSTSLSSEQVYVPPAVQDTNLRDRDHRQSPSYRASPPQQDGGLTERRVPYVPYTAGACMPQLSSNPDPRSVRR